MVPGAKVYVMTTKGSSYLWHQVRKLQWHVSQLQDYREHKVQNNLTL